MLSEERDLPTPEETTKAVKEATGKYGGADPAKDNPKAYRRKFTTMLDPELSNRLKVEAIQQSKTAADLLEEILTAYFKK